MEINLGIYFLSELLGTFLLLAIGLSVSANVLLKKTNGNSAGWAVVALGWGLAVMVGAFVANYSTGQLNPAVTLALLATYKITWAQFGVAIIGELIGAFLGAMLVAAMFWEHFKLTEDKDAIAGSFFTGAAVSNRWINLLAETFATFVLVLAILTSIIWDFGIPGPLFAALVVMAIAFGLGGLTGFSINPAREIMPRLVHFLIKIPNKGISHWNYSWIPVLGAFAGSLIAVGVTYAFLAMEGSKTWEGINTVVTAVSSILV